jgi:hypothetical protein
MALAAKRAPERTSRSTWPLACNSSKRPSVAITCWRTCSPSRRLATISQGLALYNPVEHRPYATRFGQDVEVSNLSFRSLALWVLGYPDDANEDARRALKQAYGIGQAASLMFALNHAAWTYILWGNYSAANKLLDEHIALAEQTSALFWTAFGRSMQGIVLALTGKTAAGAHLLSSGMSALRSTGANIISPGFCRTWQEPTVTSVNWTTLGAALPKP